MKNLLLATTLISSLSITTSAVSISIDYTSVAFFDTNTTNGALARAAVDAAATNISAAITTNLTAVTNYSHNGAAGSPSSTANLTGILGYTNPDTGGTETFSGALGSNEFKIFVGARSLGGLTAGQGGPGSSGISSGSSSFFNEPDLQTATDIASASFTTEFSRGTTVVTSSFNGSISAANFSVSMGPTIGNLWFDSDGSTDFHLDHTIPVVAGRVDLYSVALHEMLHTLGIGTYNSWDAQVSGLDWTGSEVIALLGDGDNLIDGDGGHLVSGIMSARISDGVMQEVLMDPEITTGTRKELTQLDLAFLRDLGFETVPEPSSTFLVGLGSLLLIVRRNK